MSQKNPNPIWQYFKKSTTDLSKAICTICSKPYSLGSQEPKKQTLHGLKLHLSKYHDTEHRQFLKRQVELDHEKEETKRRKKVDAKNVIDSSEDTHNLVQKIIPDWTTRSLKWSDESEISIRIDKAIMDLIIVDMLPYSIVEGDAFRKLNFADPNAPQKYNFKSEKYFRTTLMPRTYNKVKNKVKNVISKCTWISGTCDIWTNPTKTCSLLSLTGHFIEGPKRLKVILGATVLEKDHTSDYIEKKLTEMVHEWEIETKLFVFVRDNAANMVCAMRDTFESLGCVAHTLQLVIKDALFTQKDNEEVIKNSRKIVGHFRRSEQASRKLTECQIQCGLPTHSLLQDIEIRWNSTYIMLERLLEQKRAINLYCVEHGGITTHSPSDWDIIKNLIEVLQFFYEATLDLSRDDACISIIIPLIAMLNRKLQGDNEDDAVAKLKKQLHISLNKRFSYVKGNRMLITSTLLDPRFKSQYLNSDEVDIATKEILNFSKLNKKDVVENWAPSTEPSTSTSYSLPAKEGLWDAHDHDSRQTADSSATDECDDILVMKQLIKNYLSEPQLPRNADIYPFWNSSPYPGLRMAALKYLSAPPTSVPSEQLFSTAGQIYADRRCNLLGENAEKLLFLVYNIRLFNYNY